MPLRARQIRSIYGKEYSEEWIARSMHRWITTGASMDRIARELKVSVPTAYRYRKLMSEWMLGRMDQYVAENVVMKEIFDYETMEERMWVDARDANSDRTERRLALAEVRAIKAQKTALMDRARLFDNINLERMAEEASSGRAATIHPADAIDDILKYAVEEIEGEFTEIEDE